MTNTKITNVQGLVETKFLSLYKLDIVSKVMFKFKHKKARNKFSLSY